VFKSEPQRDASASIEGFVYQAYLTIKRWMLLGSNEILELERGEDIDVVCRAIASQKRETARILEQVKHQARPVSLSSTIALKVLSRFLDHRARNPEIPLSFRFVTTSSIVRERRLTRGTRVPAIELWEALRVGRYPPAKQKRAVSAIRELLSVSLAEKGFKASIFSRLADFTRQASETEFLIFIKQVEWSTGNANRLEVEKELLSALVLSGQARDPTDATDLLSRLFFYVFRKLSQKGDKKLTRSDLEQQLARPPLTKDDRDLLQVLSRVASLEERVTRTERAIDDNQRVVEQLSSAFDSLGKQLTSGEDIQYQSAQVILDRPPIVNPALPRLQLTQSILAELTRRSWVSIVGEPGSGKTQLCLLACEQIVKKTVWINLRGHGEEKAHLYITRALQYASGIPYHPLVENWYGEVCQRLNDSLVVLDDLPNVFPAGQVSRSLAHLLHAGRRYGLQVLSTSYYRSRQGITNPEGGPRFEITAPRFSADETLQLLALAGAPERVLNDRFANFILALTQGLPALVTAIVEFLKGKNWVLGPQEVEVIFRGDFAANATLDAQEILERTINQDTRDLLYRLSLAIGPFSKRDIENVGKVQPILRMPLELASGATTVWIQRLADESYSLSPLLRPSVSQNLSSETIKGVHAAFGIGRTSKKVLDPMDVQIALHHYALAELHIPAALLLINALFKLNSIEPPVKDEWGISTFWSRNPIPKDVPTTLKAFLRALQIVAADARGRDVSFLIADFDHQLEDTSADAAWGQFVGLGLLGLRFYSEYPTRANSYIVKAARLMSKVRLPDGSALSMPGTLSYIGLLWATANASKTDKDVLHWLETVEGLTPQEIQALISSDLAHDNCPILCDAIWLREYRKPKDEQKWNDVRTILAEVEKSANRKGIALLEAASIRTQIVVLAESEQLQADAISLAESSLSRFHGDGLATFLITEVMGRQLSYAQRWPEALRWMRRAVDLNLTAFPLLRRNLLITYSEGVAIEDPAAATAYTEIALSITKVDKLNQFRLLESLAEHAIALWLCGRRSEAFDHWQELTTVLTGITVEARTNYWQKLLKFCLQVSGYFCSESFIVKKPGTDYISAPARTLFLGLGDEPEEPIEPIMESIFLLRNAMIAEGLGLTGAAGHWTDLALESARGKVGAGTISAFGWLGIASAILANDLQKVFALTAGVEAREGLPTEMQSALRVPEADIKVQLARTPDPGQSASFAQALGIVPLVFRLAALSLKQDVSKEIEKVIVFCQERALTQQQESWRQVYEVVRNLFRNREVWSEAFSRGQRLLAGKDFGLGLICQLSAAMDAPLGTAVKIQINIGYLVERFYQQNRSIRSKLIWPAFVELWKEAARSRSIEFRTSPSYTQKQLDALLARPGDLSVRKLLKEMAFCTDASLEDWMKKWLEE
jgi:hypothetical protein